MSSDMFNSSKLAFHSEKKSESFVMFKMFSYILYNPKFVNSKKFSNTFNISLMQKFDKLLKYSVITFYDMFQNGIVSPKRITSIFSFSEFFHGSSFFLVLNLLELLTTIGDAFCVIIIRAKNRIGNPSSNPGWSS